MKNLKLFCLLFICITCIAFATSCKDEVVEAELLSEEKMNSFNSYSMSLTSEMWVKDKGQTKIKIEINGTTKISNIKEGDYIYSQQTSTTIGSTTLKQSRGYQDGYMYEIYTATPKHRTNVLVSDMSRKRFEEHISSVASDSLNGKAYFTTHDANHSEITHLDDGRKSVVLSDLNDESTTHLKVW